MRKLIITEFISLDGVMEAPGGEAGYAHAGWVGPLFSDELAPTSSRSRTPPTSCCWAA